MKAKEIFDKEEWIAKLQASKLDEKIVDAFHYVGDVIEDILSVQVEHIDELDKCRKAIKKP